MLLIQAYILCAFVHSSPIKVSSFSSPSQATLSLQVELDVQNIAYNKIVKINICDSYANANQKSCSLSSFSCSYKLKINSTHERWTGSASSIPSSAVSFLASYQVNGQVYYDVGDDGKGYSLEDPSSSSTSMTSSSPTTTMPITSSSATVPSTFPSPSSSRPPLIMMEAFTWDSISDGKRPTHFNYISSQIDAWSSAGFTIVWLPPHMNSADAQGYAPQRWYVNVNDKALREITSKLASKNMVAMADMVFNHRTAPAVDPCTGRYTAFENPAMGNWAVTRQDVGCDSIAVCPSQCGCGNADSGENNCSFPDLDHSNLNVQQLVLEYIDFATKNLKITGFRWDQAKGFSPQYFEKYDSYGNPVFSVGEFYDGNLQNIKPFLAGSNFKLPVFDFPLVFILQKAISQNSFQSLLNPATVLSFNSSLAVTFISNHDLYRSTPFGNNNQILQGYAYILTHPGVPCVFFGDYQNSFLAPSIMQLMALRVSMGIHHNSRMTVDVATNGKYAAYIQGQNGSLAVKIGTDYWVPTASNFTLALTGTNFQIWTMAL